MGFYCSSLRSSEEVGEAVHGSRLEGVAVRSLGLFSDGEASGKANCTARWRSRGQAVEDILKSGNPYTRGSLMNMDSDT